MNHAVSEAVQRVATLENAGRHQAQIAIRKGAGNNGPPVFILWRNAGRHLGIPYLIDGYPGELDGRIAGNDAVEVERKTLGSHQSLAPPIRTP